jgi:hypothetical protein
MMLGQFRTTLPTTALGALSLKPMLMSVPGLTTPAESLMVKRDSTITAVATMTVWWEGFK